MIVDTLSYIDSTKITQIIFPDSIRVVDTLRIIDVTQATDSNIYTLVNIIIVVLNLIIFLFLNFFLFKKRRREDRTYQLESVLYKDLIINNLKNYLRHSWEIEKKLNEIIKSTDNNEDIIKFAQEKFTEVEQIQESFYAEELEVIRAYKEEMAEGVKIKTDIFYDEISILWSSIMAENKPNDKTLLAKFKEIRKNYYKNIILLVKHSQPKIET